MKKMSNFVAMSLVLALLMTGCSGKIKEKNLLGSWYRDGREDASFILYDMVPAKSMGSMALEHGAL